MLVLTADCMDAVADDRLVDSQGLDHEQGPDTGHTGFQPGYNPQQQCDIQRRKLLLGPRSFFARVGNPQTSLRAGRSDPHGHVVVVVNADGADLPQHRGHC